MAKHQYDANAVELWNYFRSVIDWIQAVFPTKRKEMKGLEWGKFYNKNHEHTDLDAKKLEKKVSSLMADDDVTKKSGVYDYVLNGNEKALSIRAFTSRDKRAAYERQKGICPICKKHLSLKRCTPIISFHGQRAGIPRRTTVKCFAVTAI